MARISLENCEEKAKTLAALNRTAVHLYKLKSLRETYLSALENFEMLLCSKKQHQGAFCNWNGFLCDSRTTLSIIFVNGWCVWTESPQINLWRVVRRDSSPPALWACDSVCFIVKHAGEQFTPTETEALFYEPWRTGWHICAMSISWMLFILTLKIKTIFTFYVPPLDAKVSLCAVHSYTEY